MKFKFRNLNVNLDIVGTLQDSTVLLEVDPTILRRLTSIYYRPFSGYKKGQNIYENDLENNKRWSLSFNEVFYTLNYLMNHPDYKHKEVTINMASNDPFFVIHDLLHAAYDVLGDSLQTPPKVEFKRLQQAAELCGKKNLRVRYEILFYATKVFKAANPNFKKDLDLVNIFIASQIDYEKSNNKHRTFK